MSAAIVHILSTRAPGLIHTMVQSLKRCMNHASDSGAACNPILLTPAYFTYSASRALVQSLGKGILGLRILEPSTLMREVMELAGSGDTQTIDDIGRNMVFRQILQKLSRTEQLVYYHASAQQPGFVVRLIEQIDELRREGLEEPLLEAMSQDPALAPATRSKYHDLALIWREYDKALEGRFSDAVQRWEMMLQRLPLSGLMQDADLFIFGFDYLKTDLVQLLLRACPLARSITVGLICDADASDHTLFQAAIHSMEACAQTLASAGFQMRLERVETSRYPALRTRELQFLERTLFSSDAQEPIPMEGISTYVASDSYQECLYAAQTLIRWHREGIQWNEMAVAMYGKDTLPSLLPLVLRMSRIPFSTRRGQKMLQSGYAQYFLAVVRAVCLGYQQADMLRMLRSGMLTLSDEDRFDLENYILENGIDRKKWLRPFRVPSKPSLQAHALRMEEMRKALIAPLETLHAALADQHASGADAAAALYAFMVDGGVYTRLLAMEQQLLEQGHTLTADLNRQTWKRMNQILDQLATFSGDHHVSLLNLSLMLESAIASQEIKSIPQLADSVDVSSPDLFMTSGIRAAIVMGMQDRSQETADSLISESEREHLGKVLHHPVGLTRSEKNAREQQRLYLAIALPHEKLLCTSSLHKSDGTVLYPAQTLQKLEYLLRASKPVEKAVLPIAPSQALETLATRMRDYVDGKPEALSAHAGHAAHVWREALGYMYRSQNYHQDLQRIMEGLHVTVASQALQPDLARALYLPDRISISRLETFAECPYRHFLQSGLRPMPRRDFAFAADQRGTFYHEVLSAYMREALKKPDFPDLSEADVQKILNEILPEFTNALRDGPLDRDQAAHYQIAEMIRNVRRTAWTMTRSIAESRGFSPVGMEIPFGPSMHARSAQPLLPPVMIPLSDGSPIALSGQIDRLDRYAGKDGTVYFRLLDYKSSAHEVRRALVEAGISLQIPLYLIAMKQGYPDSVPAGALYQTVRDPLVRQDDRDQEAVEKASVKANQLTGLLLDEPEVVEAMGAVKIARTSQDASPILSKVSREEMEALMQSAREIATQLARRIMEGDTRIAPVQSGPMPPCTQCGLECICSFDPRMPGCKMRVIA
ncbi:MAG: PD-(D/E)XK nuclease family protein [Clostridia bacterium]|nr:PD-(D/E)XK nuclease family protein [Clostridia bacterium]